MNYISYILSHIITLISVIRLFNCRLDGIHEKSNISENGLLGHWSGNSWKFILLRGTYYDCEKFKKKRKSTNLTFLWLGKCVITDHHGSF